MCELMMEIEIRNYISISNYYNCSSQLDFDSKKKTTKEHIF